MHELLARATHGVDLTAPGAFWHVFFNLLNMVPWTAMFWWNVVFVIVGAVLGWWRGRVAEGVAWALLLGPIGWLIVLLRKPRATPPPLPR
ncbi:hypothetical protein [Dyella sp. A6]|uniref:hypothetical protein n=1 Tax=Dyella aluminiiresistens TaxID=3069105 RepID=UPI002E77D04B|nr:hypothetical protein [Dyella sp. A6]